VARWSWVPPDQTHTRITPLVVRLPIVEREAAFHPATCGHHPCAFLGGLQRPVIGRAAAGIRLKRLGRETSSGARGSMQTSIY
jgi:hypothetical protein